jgi:hypothetical protein
MISAKVTAGTAAARLRQAGHLLSDEKALREDMREAAEPLADRMRENIDGIRGRQGSSHTGLTAADVTVADQPSTLGLVKLKLGLTSGKEGRAFIGRFLEYGTSRMPAYPWCRPANDAEGRAHLGSRLTATTSGASDCLRIAILNSTTRWKPQRDTATSIKIEFTSLTSLTSATVKVTGPAAVEPIQATFDPRNPPNPYKVEWTATDSSGRALPAGDYMVNIMGQSESGDPISSQPADHVVSLVEVTGIKVLDPAGCVGREQSPLGAEHGDAIFAEAKSSAAGKPVCDRVQVQATVAPVISEPGPQGPVFVYFKAFDVDDTTADGAPVDDPALAEDNRGTPKAGWLVSQNGIEVDAGTGGPGIAVGVGIKTNAASATTTFRTSRRPGDNYRVVASTSESWLGGLSVPANQTDGPVVEGTTVLSDGPTGRVTRLLTVWRTLTVETARMDSPSFGQGSFDRAVMAKCAAPPCIAGNTVTDGIGIRHPDHDFTRNTWKGAETDVTPHGQTRSVHVVGASAQTTLTTETAITAVDEFGNYRLWDDELSSLSHWNAPDFTLAQSILQSAYIRLKPVPGRNQPFKRNLLSAELATSPMNDSSSPTYWATRVLLAFEGATDADEDPYAEGARTGTTSGPDAGDGTTHKPQVAVFTETLRDFTAPATTVWRPYVVSRDEKFQGTVAHELMHVLGLGHDGNRNEGALMCASLNADTRVSTRQQLTSDQRAALRDVVAPIARRVSAQCPILIGPPPPATP